jgi:cytochrome bd ubiquinol oxidase subunit II
MLFDYEVMKLIWWLLVGVLLLGFAIMDGHDMGVGTLLPFVGRNDVERRVIINTVGPHWDGNQVWFITGGGAIFAAWPLVYATAFSGFYIAMLAVLWALFFRPVGFDYRSKIANPVWRKSWDWGLFVGGAVPALIFGVAFGNLLLGVPFHFENDLRPVYTGSFFALLNPFALLAGVTSLAMLTFHGANYLMIRTEGDIFERSRRASLVFGGVMLAAFAAAGLWVAAGLPGYRITSVVVPGALPNPLDKTVAMTVGAWLDNYSKLPLTMLVPVLGFAGGLLGIGFAAARKPVAAFWSSAIAELGVIGTAGVSMFPFIMPSSSDPRSSLTVWDSVSSHLTLEVMFWAALIFTPIVISYTAWAYRVMSGKVTARYINANDHSAY